jgi:acyl-CoA synthetase (AMP-forming)/AMP-acid ligase II
MTAYVGLLKLITGGVLYRANPGDAKIADDATTNSAFAKRVMSVGARYEAIGMANSNSTENGNQFQLDVINRFSSDDQKVLFAAIGGYNENYSSIDAVKADLQTQAAAATSQQSSAAPAVEVSLSDKAKALLASDSTGNSPGAVLTPAEQAQKTLSASRDATSGAAVGLQLLQKAQETADAANAKDAAKSDTSSTSTSSGNLGTLY